MKSSQSSANSSNAVSAASSDGAVEIALSWRVMAPQCFFDANRKLFLTRCTTRSWTSTRGHASRAESGKPFNPSQHNMSTSATPQFLNSVMTVNQNLGESPTAAVANERVRFCHGDIARDKRHDVCNLGADGRELALCLGKANQEALSFPVNSAVSA